MYEIIRRLTARQLAFEQLPLLLVALGIAEVFYKFHSFMRAYPVSAQDHYL